MDNFAKVGQFHRTFKHPINDRPRGDLVATETRSTNQSLLNFRVKLIQEELDELKLALANCDFEETIDALCDILYVTYGFGHVLGVDLNRHFGAVHVSNMSKLCKTEEEANATVAWYKSQPRFVCIPDTLIETNNPNYYEEPTYEKINVDGCERYRIFDAKTSKILKNIRWTQPEHKPILDDC